MNTVLSSYGQLSGCPEILKKSCKFFCRGLDIRVLQIMKTKMRQPGTLQNPLKSVRYVVRIIHNHFVFEADLD